jgi:hypothetical protein
MAVYPGIRTSCSFHPGMIPPEGFAALTDFFHNMSVAFFNGCTLKNK